MSPARLACGRAARSGPHDARDLTGQLTFFRSTSSLGAAVTAREFFHAARCVDELLLTREKRMTSGADADSNVGTSRAGMVNRAARAHDIALLIIWMNARFHGREGAQNLRVLGPFRKR